MLALQLVEKLVVPLAGEMAAMKVVLTVALMVVTKVVNLVAWMAANLVAWKAAKLALLMVHSTEQWLVALKDL